MGSRTQGKAQPQLRAKYIEWCKVPKEKRKQMLLNDPEFPQTKSAWCTHFNVDRTTVWRWEQDPNFKRDVANEALGLVTADELAAMIEVQKRRALEGNVQSFKLLMEWTGLAGKGKIEKSVEEIEQEEDRTLADMSEEDLERIMKEDEEWANE